MISRIEGSEGLDLGINRVLLAILKVNESIRDSICLLVKFVTLRYFFLSRNPKTYVQIYTDNFLQLNFFTKLLFFETFRKWRI